jgi:hypothetical protein
MREVAGGVEGKPTMEGGAGRAAPERLSYYLLDSLVSNCRNQVLARGAFSRQHRPKKQKLPTGEIEYWLFMLA